MGVKLKAAARVAPVLRDLRAILAGGYCTRWHAYPALAHIRETLAEHHARVAQIILALHPAPSVALIDAALHHDAGEPFVGDVPAPFKRANPELAAAIGAAEDRALEGIGVRVDLSYREAEWLALADRLAAFLHVGHVRPDLLESSEWQAEGVKVLAMARAFGLEHRIIGMMPRGVRA